MRPLIIDYVDISSRVSLFYLDSWLPQKQPDQQYFHLIQPAAYYSTNSFCRWLALPGCRSNSAYR